MNLENILKIPTFSTKDINLQMSRFELKPVVETTISFLSKLSFLCGQENDHSKQLLYLYRTEAIRVEYKEVKVYLP